MDHNNNYMALNVNSNINSNINLESLEKSLNKHVKNEWKTSLCTCHAESCIVSFLLPCHVYAKIKNKSYLVNFMVYALFVTCIYNIMYGLDYLSHNICPSIKTEQCVGLGHDCNNYYINIDNTPTQCIYHEDAQVCTYNTTSCMKKEAYIKIRLYLGVVASFSYLGLFFINYTKRLSLKEDKKINDNGIIDLFASSICVTCGLAQEYRELYTIV